MDETIPDLGWWCISGGAILDALRQVGRGENPDLVYAELYVNSEHEYHEGGS